LLIALAVALTVGAVPRAHAQDGCTLVTLKGSWGFLLNGTIIQVPPVPNFPIAIVGVIHFDGASNFTRDERAVVNGHVFPPEHITGTYTVSDDCTGTTLDNAGRTSQFTIVSNRKEMFTVGTSEGSVITVIAKKQD
jgi:hypothetical protein